ncbi:MAG: UDP-N-acetylmuramoyl-L-alanyl-D-glutamate--2,6-diaminopimelate ligase [Chloroflexota bacterium]
MPDRPSKSLNQLLWHLPWDVSAPDVEARVNAVVMDSRRVQPGSLFVAISGGKSDGHGYIPDAIRRGASAVVGTQPVPGLAVPYVQVPDGRLALAYLCAAFRDFPARKLLVIGVTGTDGKTTTCNMLYHILQAAGARVGMISTVNAQIGDDVLDTGFHVTTPESPDVQRYLDKMVRAGLTHVILEATSHGLAQQRVAACDFDIGVITNITHEHLDYHGTYQAYRAAKGSLFASLANTPAKSFNPPRGAVLNRDDRSYDYLAEISQVAQLSYGLDPKAQVRAVQVAEQREGLRFTVEGHDLAGKAFAVPVATRLEGAYNVANSLAAVAAAMGFLGVPPEAVQQGLAAMPGVPGRMERLDLGQDFSAIVDFAHTPNALQRSLEAARSMTNGRVIAVFGSAGLRDRQKRRMMAEVSGELADFTVLTAEDPRSESLDGILEEMAGGVTAKGGVEGKTFWRIPDRGEAIRYALRLARPGDLVIACGKGHEQSMCFGETEYPWDDRIAMRAALAELLGAPGPEMPYLPTQSPST